MALIVAFITVFNALFVLNRKYKKRNLFKLFEHSILVNLHLTKTEFVSANAIYIV